MAPNEDSNSILFTENPESEVCREQPEVEVVGHGDTVYGDNNQIGEREEGGTGMSVEENVFDVAVARRRFPGLAQPQIFLDNAGGTQTLDTVISSINDYLTNSNAQLGATYGISKHATALYEQGMEAAAAFVNASVDEIAIGPSTTQLFANLSLILDFPPDAEIIVSSIDHEANISAWVRIAEARKLHLKWWTPLPPPHNLILTVDNLRPLLSERTSLVTCTHASNLLGTIHDVKAIANEVHKVPGAKLCVDGVAYAPHRLVDVKALGVDFYAFSWYKVYGPHIALLYASMPAQAQLKSLGHYFFSPVTTLSQRLGLAGASYELVAAIPSVLAYFGADRQKTWDAMSLHEQRLQSILLDFLNSREDVTVYGERSADARVRLPVLSFSIKGQSSREIAVQVEESSNFGIRWGHVYAKRMVDDLLGLKVDGVIRVSMVHYNTEDEIRGLVETLSKVFPPAVST